MKYKCFLLLTLITLTVQDLPVHCLSGDIEGDWLIHMGDNNNDSDLKCGHNKPDGNLDHYDMDVEKSFNTKYEIMIHLERPNMVQSVINNSQIGKWTMVYDEGFNIDFKNYTFFAFSKYNIEDFNYNLFHWISVAAL